MNVDFDCLFDKGLTLNKPEIVPFRLTQHVVDAFGVSGYEGPFRRTMEVAARRAPRAASRARAEGRPVSLGSRG